MKPNQIERPQETYFFERADGSIFSTREQEAHNILKNRVRIVGQDTGRTKLIGVSDGTKFHQAVIESHEIYRTNPEAALERLRQGEKEELEAARGHIKLPRNFDEVDVGGRPTSINSLR